MHAVINKSSSVLAENASLKDKYQAYLDDDLRTCTNDIICREYEHILKLCPKLKYRSVDDAADYTNSCSLTAALSIALSDKNSINERAKLFKYIPNGNIVLSENDYITRLVCRVDFMSANGEFNLGPIEKIKVTYKSRGVEKIADDYPVSLDGLISFLDNLTQIEKENKDLEVKIKEIENVNFKTCDLEIVRLQVEKMLLTITDAKVGPLELNSSLESTKNFYRSLHNRAHEKCGPLDFPYLKTLYDFGYINSLIVDPGTYYMAFIEYRNDITDACIHRLPVMVIDCLTQTVKFKV
jgi:hypothetical protein